MSKVKSVPYTQIIAALERDCVSSNYTICMTSLYYSPHSLLPAHQSLQFSLTHP